MLSKEEIEKVKKGLIEELGRTITANECGLSTNDFSESIKILEGALQYIEQLEKTISRKMSNNKRLSKKYLKERYKNKKLEADKQKLIDINNKYLQKLVYALTPTQHALGDDYNNAFKKIVAENIDLETCKIKRKLKECWGIDKKF